MDNLGVARKNRPWNECQAFSFFNTFEELEKWSYHKLIDGYEVMQCIEMDADEYYENKFLYSDWTVGFRMDEDFNLRAHLSRIMELRK